MGDAGGWGAGAGLRVAGGVTVYRVYYRIQLDYRVRVPYSCTHDRTVVDVYTTTT